MEEEKLTEQVIFRVSKRILKLLDGTAESEGRTRSNYLQRILKMALPEA